MFSYKDIDYVSERFIKDVLTADGDIAPAAKPKKKTLKVDIDGRTYSIVLDIRGQLSNLLSEKEDVLYHDYRRIMKKETAGILREPLDEIRYCKEYEDLRMKNRTDYPERPPYLIDYQSFIRTGTFLKVCCLCAKDEILERILHNAAKWPDGSLNGKQVFSIASLYCAEEDTMLYYPVCAMYSLYAEVAGAYEMRIHMKKRRVTEKNWSSINEDLLCAEPELFGLTLDWGKNDNITYPDKISIRFRKKKLNVPVVIQKDGTPAFAAPEPVPVSAFSDVLVKKEGYYEIVEKDLSRDFKRVSANHVLTYRYDSSGLGESIERHMGIFSEAEDYYSGKLTRQEMMVDHNVSDPLVFRGLYRNEAQISMALMCLFKGVREVLNLDDDTLTQWCDNAKLKKNGTFHRSYNQHIHGEHAYYSAYPVTDTEYLIEIDFIHGDLKEQQKILEKAEWIALLEDRS